MAELLTQSFSFADGNGGHVCDLGSAPSVGDTDLLFVNSDTVVSTPSGFTLRATRVTNQGSYVFSRKAAGGEGQTVTVTTTGNNNTQVTHRRWAGLNAFDVSATAGADATSGTSTPTATTAALAESTEVSFAFAALSSNGTANQSAPTWTSGYGNSTTAKQGSGASGVTGFTAYKTGAGTAAEAVQATGWTGDGCQNRYTLVVTFTTNAAGNDGSGTPASQATTASGTGTITNAGSGTAAAAATTATGTGAITNAGSGTAASGTTTASGGASSPLSGSGTAAGRATTATGTGTGPLAGFTQDRADLLALLGGIAGVTAVPYPAGIPAQGQAWPLLGPIDLSSYGVATWHAVFVAGGDGRTGERWLDANLITVLDALRPWMYVDTVTPVDLGNNVVGVDFAGRREIR